VLGVAVPRVLFDRLGGPALVEREVVEGRDVPLVAFEGIHSQSFRYSTAGRLHGSGSLRRRSLPRQSYSASGPPWSKLARSGLGLIARFVPAHVSVRPLHPLGIGAFDFPLLTADELLQATNSGQPGQGGQDARNGPCRREMRPVCIQEAARVAVRRVVLSALD